PPLPAALNPAIPADLQAVCLKCLQKDPAARFADATALAADLGRVRAGLAPLSALFPPGRLGTGAEEALRRLAGRRRLWPWALAALAALALATAGALGWWRWDARKAEDAQVRARLAPLAAARPAPGTAAADLTRLAQLSGDGDPQVQQGRARLAELERLHTALDALAGRSEDPAGRAAARDLVGQLDRATGGGDPALAGWRTRLAAVEAEIDALRQRLGALERSAVVDAVQRAEATPRLARLGQLAGDDDAEVVRWRTLVQRAEAEEEQLRRRCARLDEPAALTAAALAELEAAHRRLLALAADGSLPASWARRLDDDRRSLTTLRHRLFRALAAPADDAAADVEAQTVATALADWQAIDAGDQQRVEHRRRQRLERQAAAAAQRQALAARLAALDAPRPLPPGIEEDLVRYETMAGFDDSAAQRWRSRFAHIRLLQARLEPLARPTTPPAGAKEDLAALAALVGSDDPLVAAGMAHLASVAARQAPLAAALDHAQPIPADSAAQLDAYAALVGSDDADVMRWRAKLVGWAQAATALAALERTWVLDPSALARAEAALIQATAACGPAATAAWRQRLDELRGAPAPAWAAEHGHDRYGPWLLLRVGSGSQRLRWLPPGEFLMGSPADEPGHQADEAPVRVRLTRGCWIADSECDQELWLAVMGSQPGRLHAPRLPVAEVSAFDAEMFCARLAGPLPGCQARLPSEAEWEAAARAGADGPWGGLDPAQGGGIAVHATDAPWPAQEGSANPLGLRHMLGNLREWCGEAYGPQPGGDPAIDPRRGEGPLRALRGGSWREPLDACRVANRLALAPGRNSPLIGFRFVCVP
ncbi:MAG: SUMF1/EgtB/PvdO family nonheme iron enzyme, partial [Planctomycetes bacterium]|nr:SUMF1/EgtB/PvdO family nonheme iron enzyme [Planctomycetota bacterium]